MKTILKNSLVFSIFLIVQLSYSQLANFTFNVTKTNETCTGNGTLTFAVSGATAGATFIYSVYLLPNTTTPIVVTSNSVINSLVAGNYNVVALQTLGALSNSQQQNITIVNLTNPLVYSIIGVPETCHNGSITVNVTQGNPVTYETISGPTIVAPQISNVLSGLSSGTYNVKVTDTCGDAVVQTITILKQPYFIISDFVTNCQLPSCTTMTGSFAISATIGNTLVYPIVVEFTLFPPSGGTPIIINQTLTTGSTTAQDVPITFPFYSGQISSYSIKVTDPCGNTKTGTTNIINNNLNVNLTSSLNGCFRDINISVCNFLPPYNVSFLSAPAGFVPANFNVNNLGPFNLSYTTYANNSTYNIPYGNYIIKITDSCGRTAQNQITINPPETDYILTPNPDQCINLVHLKIPYTGVTISSIIFTAAPITFINPIPYDASSNIVNGVYETDLLPGVYTVTGINTCGNPYTFILDIPLTPPFLISASSVGCIANSGTISIAGPTSLTSVIMTQAPSGYSNPLPFNASSYINSSGSFIITNLPFGNYTFVVIDSCGITRTLNGTIAPNPNQNPLTVEYRRGCQENFGSVYFYVSNGNFQQVKIISAPTNFNQTLPYDVSFNIRNVGGFLMNSLPEGNYVFYSKDICNVERNSSIYIPGYHSQNNIIVQPNCGEFDINMDYVQNETTEHKYWLQKLNPLNNLWGHPYTNVPYIQGSNVTNVNSYELINLIVNYNIVAQGTFRIIKINKIFSNGGEINLNLSSTFTTCFDIIKTFDYTDQLKITAAYNIPCNNGTDQVLIVANGILPLTYKITSKDGLPFIVNNNTSNVFTGLQAAIYNFQITDNCGNILNRLLEINSLPEPTILPTNLCANQNGQLSVQAISYLSYQWWKGTDTTTILSTTNELNFTPFTSASAGVYYVRIYSTSTISCIDKIISYTIPLLNNPNAGLDNEITICGNSATINLFNYIGTTYDTNGVWTETTSSGALTGNNWLPIGVSYGLYEFKYTVSGFCSIIDESIVKINFQEAPSIPVISVSQNSCSGGNLQFISNTIPNVTYDWSGPNGFTSNNQNPTIANSSILNTGEYILKVKLLNGCETSASLDVTINPNPNFTIEAKCIGSNKIVTIIPTDNSFDTNLVNYVWTGPQGYTNTINPINVTSLPLGTYNVTVTNQDACFTSNSIEINSTVCGIPNVLTPNEDGANDFLDLSGLDVEKLQIYSRWGRLVYEKNNYINEWIGQNMNDGLLPGSVYYYTMLLKSGEEKIGWTFLVR